MATDIRDRRILPALVAIVVAAFLVIPMVTSAPLVNAQSQEEEDPCEGVPESTFDDRDEADEVHRRSIDCVDHHGISSGDGTGSFLPNRLVKRGQMATFIIQTLEAADLGDRIPDGDAPDDFDDIEGHTHRENINRLARIGVVRGENGSFNPDTDVRRDQMATFLLQAKEWAYQDDYEAESTHFSDVTPANAHFDNIDAAYEQGLVRGTREPEEGVPSSGTYEPARSVRRQNMASFLSNELREVVDAPQQFCEPASPEPTASGSPSPSPSPSEDEDELPLPIGGDDDESPSPSPSPTTSPQATETTTTDPSPTGSPCAEPTGSPSPSPTASASPSPSASPSASPSPPEDDECPLDDPTGILCPDDDEESPSPSPSPSPTSDGGVALDLNL